MCGISGIINLKGSDIQQIKNMSDIISHRGPDGEGFMTVDGDNQVSCWGGQDTPVEVWSSKFSYSPVKRIESLSIGTPKLAFGHRRLSILDLSPAGHQPMSYAKGRFWIIFNGEIYNFHDLKNSLEKLGYKFITRTDTEVVLAAYAEWGEGCLERLVGMWAFAIYDQALKEIFLARDRYGIKPLYYWFSPDKNFYFASEIKQFTVLNGWQSKMNPQRAYDHLVYSISDHTDESMFEGVYQLPSGTYFRSTLDSIVPDVTNRVNAQKWYLLKREPFKGSFDDAAEGFKKLFERSVNEHLNADVPIGTALSGGLDSSSIVCEVNRILRNEGKSEQQKTFSSCSLDERFDEKKWMDIIVGHTRVDARFIYPTLNEVIEQTQGILWHHDEPYQSQSPFLAYNVFKLAHATGVKVLLNGQGADEYLGGYSQFTSARYANMVKKLKIMPLIDDIISVKKIKPVSYMNLIKGIAFSLLPPYITRSLTSVRSSSDHIKKIINNKRFRIQLNHPFESIPVMYRTLPEISRHLTFYSTLPKYLRWEDRNSMAHSVEARVPFLDHRLVEFTYNLPDDFLEKDGINKRIMREALIDLLPDKIKNRKDKMGYITPEELWVKKENPAFFRQKIAEAITITDGIIKPEVLTYFDNVVNGSLPFDYTYWRIILFSEWIKKYQVNI